MRKHGYTLAEVLISLTVIGVIAALMLPLVNKYRPDATKMQFLKNYDAIKTVVGELTSNKTLYPVLSKDTENRILYADYPLLNTDAVDLKTDLIKGGKGKFCRILGTSLQSQDISKCDVDDSGYVGTYKDSEFKPNFVIPSGVEYMVTTNLSTEDTKACYLTDIYIDVDGSKGTNCLYESEKCKLPDRFKLTVLSDGEVIASDPMSKEFLSTRINWRKMLHNINAKNDAIDGCFNLAFCEKELDPNVVIPVKGIPNDETPDDDTPGDSVPETKVIPETCLSDGTCRILCGLSTSQSKPYDTGFEFGSAPNSHFFLVCYAIGDFTVSYMGADEHSAIGRLRPLLKMYVEEGGTNYRVVNTVKASGDIIYETAEVYGNKGEYLFTTKAKIDTPDPSYRRFLELEFYNKNGEALNHVELTAIIANEYKSGYGPFRGWKQYINSDGLSMHDTFMVNHSKETGNVRETNEMYPEGTNFWDWVADQDFADSIHEGL